MTVLFRKIFNYFLDILLILSGFASTASSYIIWFVLPHGMGFHRSVTHCVGGGTGPTGNCESFLGYYRYTWIDIHNWTSVALFGIVLIHLLLHWSWIVETTRRIATHLQRRTLKVLELYGAAVLLFILFIFDSASGLIVWLVLPRGVGDYDKMVSGAGRTFLGLQRNIWVDLHAWVAVAIVAIILVHLLLNWNWVIGVTKNIFRWPKSTAS